MRIVPALDRGLRVLDLLATRGKALTGAEVARELEIPRSAVYEILNTLAHHGVIQIDDNGRVGLGRQLFVLGSAYAASIDLVALAQPIAQQVMLECEETVQVGVLDGLDVIYLAKAESPHAVRLVSSVGSRIPAHCTALGKMLLASLPVPEIEARLAGAELRRMTSRSITDPAALRVELAAARDAGHAWEHGESNLDVVCVAAPVRGAGGEVIAAISASAPSTRLAAAERRSRTRELVQEGARRLSASLGHVG